MIPGKKKKLLLSGQKSFLVGMAMKVLGSYIDLNVHLNWLVVCYREKRLSNWKSGFGGTDEFLTYGIRMFHLNQGFSFMYCEGSHRINGVHWRAISPMSPIDKHDDQVALDSLWSRGRTCAFLRISRVAPLFHSIIYFLWGTGVLARIRIIILCVVTFYFSFFFVFCPDEDPWRNPSVFNSFFFLVLFLTRSALSMYDRQTNKQLQFDIATFLFCNIMQLHLIRITAQFGPRSRWDFRFHGLHTPWIILWHTFWGGTRVDCCISEIL